MSSSLHTPRTLTVSRLMRCPVALHRRHSLAIKIAACYLVASICWVVYSDELAQLLPFGPDEQELVNSYKGLAYAALVTVLLYLLLRRRESELAQAEQDRLDTEEEARHSLTNAQLAGRTGSWTLELRSRKLWWSDALVQLAHLAPQDFRGHFDFLIGYLPQHDFDRLDMQREQALRLGRPINMTCRFVTPKQEVLYFHVTSRVERDVHGAPVRLVGSAQDVTSRLRRRQTLLQSQRRLRAAFGSAPLAVVIALPDGRATWLNTLALRLLGRSRDQLPGSSIATLFSGDDRWFQGALDELSNVETDRTTLERRIERDDGTAVWVRVHASLARAPEGGSGHVVLMLDDISVERARKQGQVERRPTDRHAANVVELSGEPLEIPDGRLPYAASNKPFESGRLDEQLARITRTDKLTGLPNRQALEEYLQAATCKGAQTGESLSLILLGFDRFHAINEILGKAEADRLLRQASARLVEALDGAHFVARYGGARFAVLAPPDTSRERLTGLARRCAELLQCDRTSSAGTGITITVSAGMSMIVPDQADRNSLLSQAESALALQGPMERGTQRFFSAEEAAVLTRRLAIESGLHQASLKDEFEIHLQPKWSLSTGQITGAEALLRWQSKSLGTICPTEFIPIAEQHPVIHEIGRWVIRRVVDHLALVKLQHPDFQVSINLSARQLEDADLPGFIARTVAKAGLSTRSLQFELTETWLIENASAAKCFLARLRELGFSIALDDFGVGYSSLAYLAQFPVDVVKLDRSFVERLPESETACVVATSVLDLSRRLHIQTIAEGVESEAQRAFLQAAGCDQAQGWLVAPALPVDQFFRRLDRSDFRVPLSKALVLSEVDRAWEPAFRI